MASVAMLLSPLSPSLHHNLHSSRLHSTTITHPPSRLSITCKAKDDVDSTSNPSTVELSAAIAGLVSNPVIGVSLYTLKTTGCGLRPGPGGLIGAVEGVSYLVVAGIVGWSLYTKVKTGKGLPAGQFGLLGGVEGLSYLTVVAIVVVFGLQFFQQGYIPGPVPVAGDQCFG